MDRIHNVYKWSKTPEAVVSKFTNAAKNVISVIQFGFKYATITVLLWLPAVVRSSASECYFI